MTYSAGGTKKNITTEMKIKIEGAKAVLVSSGVCVSRRRLHFDATIRARLAKPLIQRMSSMLYALSVASNRATHDEKATLSVIDQNSRSSAGNKERLRRFTRGRRKITAPGT